MYKLTSLLVLIISLPIAAQTADPTKPFGLSANASKNSAKSNALILQTIVDSDTQKSVVISGKLLTVGDNIRQYKLAKIAKNYVVLSSAEKNITLSLFSPVVSKVK